jgi:hypothetical protein
VAASEPLDPRIRHAISQWPDEAQILAGPARRQPASASSAAAARRPTCRPARQKVSSAGVIHVDKLIYEIDVDHAFKQVLVVTDGDKVLITDVDGVLGEDLAASEGPRTVTDVLMQTCHPCPETSHASCGRVLPDATPAGRLDPDRSPQDRLQ